MHMADKINLKENQIDESTIHTLFACIAWHELKAAELGWEIKKYTMDGKRHEKAILFVDELRMHKKFAESIKSIMH